MSQNSDFRAALYEIIDGFRDSLEIASPFKIGLMLSSDDDMADIRLIFQIEPHLGDVELLAIREKIREFGVNR